MLSVDFPSQVLLQWDAHYLRLMVRGELSADGVKRLFEQMGRHLDAAPFHRFVLDFRGVEDAEGTALQRLAAGLEGALAPDADVFFLYADPSLRHRMVDAGVLRVFTHGGTTERELDFWVRLGSVRHAQALAAANAQAEAPRRWNVAGWLKSSA